MGYDLEVAGDELHYHRASGRCSPPPWSKQETRGQMSMLLTMGLGRLTQAKRIRLRNRSMTERVSLTPCGEISPIWET